MLTPDLALAARAGLPDALRVLVRAYPRMTWDAHPGFTGLVQFWMQRHMMFRQLAEVLRDDAQQFSDAGMDFATYSARLSHNGGTLLNELHGHHHIEDHHYFPQLIGLDARVERGFELLEQDHQAMDGVLHALATQANAVLHGGNVGKFLEELGRFSDLLERHLTDEEEIVVPVILHTGFRG